MQDPHVEILIYRLEAEKNTSYNNPPPITYDAEEFSAELKDELLKVRLKRHFPTVEEARSEVDWFIRAWELEAALKRGSGEFRFTYENSEVIDRNPSAQVKSRTVSVSAHAKITASMKAEISVSRGTYPDPPEYFRISPDVETLWHRFQGYLDGNEPLLSMAYFCLTLVESSNGGRKKSANQLRVSSDLLNKLGEITSTRGDDKTARKRTQNTPLRSISDAERAWVEGAIKMIIRRVAEVNQNSSLPMIGMDHLPQV